MGATHPEHSADDAGMNVPTEGFPEGDPMLDTPEQDTEPDQGAAADPQSGEGVPHPADAEGETPGGFDAG